MSPQAGQAATKGPQTFEFTKRKRWADLLVAELADVIVFVLSPSREVLYCGNAISELLGWRVVDLLDRDLLDLLASQDDQLAFCSAFQQSINTNAELLSYLHFKCNSFSASGSSGFKEVLVELKGYPHFVNNECKCFFAMARPYPSRNTSMLNTFLELKMGNERLQQRLSELHSLLPEGSPLANSTANGMYAAPSTRQLPVSTRFLDSHTSYMAASSSIAGTSSEDLLRNSCDISDGTYYGTNTLYTSSQNLDEDTEDGIKRKKVKKSHPAEQYVCITCGRTDSPEWRKGPLGPKTLCNACGLRWAKQMRRYDEPVEGSNSNELPLSSSGA
ncbi:white collar 2 type of transcription factor [Amanita muscaria]